MRPRIALSLGIVTLLLSCLPFASAWARGEDTVRRLEQRHDAADLSDLSVDMPVGHLLLTGTDGDAVELELTIECNRRGWGSSSCPDRAEDVELRADRRGDRLEIELDGYSTWGSRGMEVTLSVRAPARLASVLDLGIGELEVEGMASHLSVDVGIGEVTVRMAENRVAAVELDAGIGEAALRGSLGRRESAGLFVRQLSWNEGSGEARVRVDLGIGEIDVRLQ